MQLTKRCIAEMQSAYSDFTNAEKRISDFILKDPSKVIHLSIQELAKESGVSESSIVKFCRKLGYTGYTDFKIALAQNVVLQKEYIYEGVEIEKGVPEIIDKVFNAAIRSLSDSLKILNPAEVEKAADSIIRAKKVALYGVGTSAPIAEIMCHRLLYIGINSVFFPDPHLQVAVALTLNSEDVAVAICHSGRTEDTLRAVKAAKKQKAKIICITNYADSPIASLSDIRLITSFKEFDFRVPSILARVVQLAIIDAIYMSIALKSQEQTIRQMDKLKHYLR